MRKANQVDPKNNKILAPLDRLEAEKIWNDSVHGGLLVEEETSDALRAALDTDREETVKRIGRLIHAGVTGQRPEIGGPEDLAAAVLDWLENGGNDE